MSSKLSAAAKHRISGFLTPQELRETKKVDREWRLIVELFFSLRLQKFCPSTDYLRSKEFELTLNNGSVDNAVRLIFEGGRPTKFWLRIPDGLIPKMVEHFLAPTNEPSMLPFTFISQTGWRPGEFWPEVYVTRFACPTCTEIVSVENENYGGVTAEHLPESIRDQLEQEGKLTMKYIVEKYHMRNACFARTFTLEFHFKLAICYDVGCANRPYKCDLRKIVASMAEPSCIPPSKLHQPTTRTRVLQLSEILKEVFAFNSRYRLEVCRLVCIEWKELADRGTHIFALHRLKCSFQHHAQRDLRSPSMAHIDRHERASFFDVTNFGDDLPYNDQRRFEFTSSTPPEYACALIRSHLRDCYVMDFKRSYHWTADLEHPFNRTDFEWSMLPALENCSIGRLRLDIKREDLARVRATVEDVFAKRKVQQWTTRLKESTLQELVEQYDLLRWPTIQQLTEHDIMLHADRAEPVNPFWTNALHFLPNCKTLTIGYCKEDTADFRPACQALVDVAKAFERGEISDVAVDRIVFNPNRSLVFPFDHDMPAYRELRIPNSQYRDSTRTERHYVWDVYHFQNARTMAWLTTFVGQSINHFAEDAPLTTLHMKKGKFRPNDSFL